MPKYTLKVGGNKVTSVETNQTIGQTVERTLSESTPQTFIDGGGNIDKSRWREQEHTREQLLEYKKIRESGGPIASILKTKALLAFGTESEWQTENEDLTEWLDEQFDTRELLFTDIGEDGFTYPGVPCEIVETRGGGFSHVELIEPWTIIPKTDNKGEIQGFVQEVKVNGSIKRTPIEKEKLAYIVLNKSNGRDKTGVSELETNRSEIERFYDNQESIKNSSQLHGFPQRHIKVGREGAAPPNDNELRRLRSRFSKKWNELTMFVTGRDVEMDTLEAADFDYRNLTESDVKILMWAFGLPQEIANTGSDGLGSGKPADTRWKSLELSLKAYQKRLATQFIEQIAKPVVEEYSPYNPEDINDIKFEPLESDVDEKVNRAKDLEDYLTTDEIREAGNYEPLEDEEKGGSFDSPGEEESDDDFGGLFASDGVSLSEPRAKTLQEDFEATLFELVATEDQEDFETGARLGVGVDFPNSGVYVDWNIGAWPEDERLDGPHVSEYATVEDAQTVAQGEVRELQASELGDSGNGHKGCDCGLTLSEHVPDGIPDWERHLMEMHQQAFEVSSDTRVLNFVDSATPEFVKDRIRDTIMSGAIFSDIDGVSDGEIMQLREFLTESLTSDGWTLDGVADQLMQLDSVEDRAYAELVAESETAGILNTTRANGYESEGFGDDKFAWVGDMGDRTTEACKWLIRETNPNYGGEPRPLDELKELIDEAPSHDPEMDDDLARPDNYMVHPRERKTFTRQVGY